MEANGQERSARRRHRSAQHLRQFTHVLANQTKTRRRREQQRAAPGPAGLTGCRRLATGEPSPEAGSAALGVLARRGGAQIRSSPGPSTTRGQSTRHSRARPTPRTNRPRTSRTRRGALSEHKLQRSAHSATILARALFPSSSRSSSSSSSSNRSRIRQK